MLLKHKCGSVRTGCGLNSFPEAYTQYFLSIAIMLKSQGYYPFISPSKGSLFMILFSRFMEGILFVNLRSIMALFGHITALSTDNISRLHYLQNS